MSASGLFIHRGSVVGTPVTTFGAAYGPSLRADVDLYSAQPTLPAQAQRFKGTMGTLVLEGTIAGGATKLTVKGYQDVTGVQAMWLDPIEVNIEPGVAPGTTGCVLLTMDYIVALRSRTVSIFAKTDAGTFILTSACLVLLATLSRSPRAHRIP